MDNFLDNTMPLSGNIINIMTFNDNFITDNLEDCYYFFLFNFFTAHILSTRVSPSYFACFNFFLGSIDVSIFTFRISMLLKKAVTTNLKS